MRLGPLGYHDTVFVSIVALSDSGSTPLQRSAYERIRVGYLSATKRSAR